MLQNLSKKFQKKRIKVKFKSKRVGDMKEIVSSNKKLNNFIKWKPKFNSIDKMVSSTFIWNKYLKKNL